MSEPEDNPEVILALLPKDSPRAPKWHRMFGGLRVPVDHDEPRDTILPDGRTIPCYFVDFDVTGENFHYNLAMMAPTAQIQNMIAAGVYPIEAEGVTVVKGPKSLWTTPKK